MQFGLNTLVIIIINFTMEFDHHLLECQKQLKFVLLQQLHAKVGSYTCNLACSPVGFRHFYIRLIVQLQDGSRYISHYCADVYY